MESSHYFSLRHFKHLISVGILFACIAASVGIRGGWTPSEFSAVERYGLVISFILYILQILLLVPLPFFIFNFLGVVLLNVFPQRPKLQRSPLIGPFLCFRVVTKGLYPELVNDNVEYNIKLCRNVGLHNFIFEVVTDIPVNLKTNIQAREILVPGDYQTKFGSLYKARALQYALEPEVDSLSPGDWIVHLDEETVLTEDAVIGIVNFTGAAQYSFGQGVITYGHGKIVNWVTTLADSIRVGIDYGYLRFSLGVLHKPIFSWKGSFIVADAEAEKKISFDHGPEASIAEDCFFACVAFSRGYSFGFVDGVMLEKSTFTLSDFMRQRRRWVQGILLTALSKKIPWRFKIGPVLMSFSSCTLPFNILLVPVSILWPMPSSPFLMFTYSFNMGTAIYLFILGTVQTFCIQKYGWWRCCLLALATIFCGLVGGVLENIVSILVFWLPKSSATHFYIVKKQVPCDYIKVV
ncbi:beta-1,4-mannosyltransferase egh-like [Physella acuta]|uniref:beta-1,4-mannosyltransferase egh-like n=1 Tax=Physella acuta TaxID=109671 RepID=UPI0027DB7A63|nr:beta-1,4-mannosyltransferase egh-like [Physella acuta]